MIPTKLLILTPVQTNSTFKVTGSKIELRLRKGTLGQRWEQLEETEAAPIIQHNRTKNWDQIGKEADEEHKKDVEEGGGEAALQQMFKVFLSLFSDSGSQKS